MAINISELQKKQQYEVISDPIQVKLYLKRILDNRTLLSATISGDDSIFNSVMISIDNDKSQIMIDQLHPEHGHKKFLAKGKLTLFAGLEGIDLSFQCVLVDVDEKSGIPFYTLSFPQHVKYYQRRSSYRVQVIRSLSVPIHLTTSEGETFKGELDNISSGGLRVRFAVQLPKELEHGSSIPGCEFNLPDEGIIAVSVEIRHIAVVEKGGLSYLGLRYENLNSLDQRSINRFVTSLERELRRRAP